MELHEGSNVHNTDSEGDITSLIWMRRYLVYTPIYLDGKVINVQPGVLEGEYNLPWLFCGTYRTPFFWLKFKNNNY